MKRVALYLRVSTDKQAQEGDSIPAQRDALAKYAKDHGYVIVGEYMDDGISGTKLERDELQRLLEDVKRGMIDLILFTKLDRWFRSVRHYVNTQEILDDHNVEWLAIWEPMYDSSSPQGRMLINMMVNLAQFEAEQTGQRIRQVFAYKRSKGEVLNGNPPYGFRIENKHLVPDPCTAEKAKSIFAYYAENGNLRGTVSYAESINVMLGIGGIKRMLRNVKYCPVIVDKSLFEDVQRLMSRNIKYNTHRTYIFTGLIVCGCCGCHFGGLAKTDSSLFYRCNRYYKKSNIKTSCDNSKAISETVMEKYLLSNLIPMLKEYIAKQEEEEKPKDNSKRIKTLEKKLDKLKDLYLNDMLTLDELKSERAKIQTEIASLQTVSKHDLTAHKTLLQLDLDDYYTQLTREQKRGFWRSIIDHITFDKDRIIEVYFL